MAFLTLTEAADYARFACAAYAVFEHEDKDAVDENGEHTEGHDGQSCGCCNQKSNLRTYASVVRSGSNPFCKLMHEAERFCEAHVTMAALMSGCCCSPYCSACA